MIHVSNITGFLGSGKTTLLNHLVRQPGMADTAAIMNEFGEIGIDDPLPWDAVRAWLETVASLRGADLQRVKGILNVSGHVGPVVVHGVQHVFHPPVKLREWPDAARTTRIVFITRNLEKAALENALSALVARERAA